MPRVLDIPEALGLLAATPLTIIGGDEKAFEGTTEIYKLAGASDKLKRKQDDVKAGVARALSVKHARIGFTFGTHNIPRVHHISQSGVTLMVAGYHLIWAV